MTPYQQAARYLQQGEIIAYPTEAVWGLGCDPNNEAIVQRLLTLKQRPMAKGLIVVAATTQQLAPYLDGLPNSALDKLRWYWPGPITYLVPDNGYAPAWIKGDHDSIALRVSAHPTVVSLCVTCGGAIVSTSANVAQQAPIKQRAQLDEEPFASALAMVVEGPLGDSEQPTPIRDLLTDEVYR